MPDDEPSSCVVRLFTIVLNIFPFSKITLIVFAMIIANATTNIGLAPSKNPSTIAVVPFCFIK